MALHAILCYQIPAEEKTHVHQWHYMLLYKKSSVKKQAHINQLRDRSHEKAKKMTTAQQRMSAAQLCTSPVVL